ECGEEGQGVASSECVPPRDCVPGEDVSAADFAAPADQCSPCGTGTYSAVMNAQDCVPWDDCGWLEVSKAGTNISDAICAEVDTFHQFGTSGENSISAVAADASGRVVVVGYTDGPLYANAEGAAFVRQY